MVLKKISQFWMKKRPFLLLAPLHTKPQGMLIYLYVAGKCQITERGQLNFLWPSGQRQDLHVSRNEKSIITKIPPWEHRSVVRSIKSILSS